MTKRSACPARRSSETASDAPGIGSRRRAAPPSMSSRMHAMERESIRVTRSVSPRPSRDRRCVSRARAGRAASTRRSPSTRVEASLDVEASTALTDIQKRRVVARAGPDVLRAVAQDERSQARNRRARDRAARREAARGARRSRVGALPRDRRQARERRLEGSAAARGRRRSGSLRARNRLASGGRAPARIAPSRASAASARGSSTTSVVSVARSGRSRWSSRTRLADHMNIRRGEVHEVVSVLLVPAGTDRCGPRLHRARLRLLRRARAARVDTPGAIEVACLGHCDLAPALTRGDEIVPAVTHSTNDGPGCRARRRATRRSPTTRRAAGSRVLRELLVARARSSRS